MPRADTVPAYHVTLHEVPTASNPLGVKGVGEAGPTAAPPAVINAIVDALQPYGILHVPMPATPYAIWQAIQEAKRKGGSCLAHFRFDVLRYRPTAQAAIPVRRGFAMAAR